MMMMIRVLTKTCPSCLFIQKVKSGKGAEESAVLQQALYDRDEAIEK